MYPSEVRGGEFLAIRVAQFMSVLENCQLMDLGAVQRRYTWFRKINNRLVLSKRLDRAVADIDWRLAFPNAFVEVLNRVHSDHCPILLHCDVAQYGSSQRPFRFIAAWA